MKNARSGGPEKVRRKPERPGEILHAAFEEFVLNGYAATRLEDVAARAGVTKGTVYFHFENKENVFVQMVRELSKPMQEKADAFLAENEGKGGVFFARFLDFAHEQILEDRTFREILRLLIAEARRFPDLVDDHFTQIIDPILGRVRLELVAAAGRGEVRNTPALDFPDVLLSPVLMLNILMLIFSDRRHIDAKGQLDAAKDILMFGLLPRPDGP